MLHYYGDKLAMELGAAAKFYIPLYVSTNRGNVYVPFMDLEKGKKRWVKFEYLAGQWVYVDLCDTCN